LPPALARNPCRMFRVVRYRSYTQLIVNCRSTTPMSKLRYLKRNDFLSEA